MTPYPPSKKCDPGDSWTQQINVFATKTLIFELDPWNSHGRRQLTPVKLSWLPATHTHIHLTTCMSIHIQNKSDLSPFPGFCINYDSQTKQNKTKDLTSKNQTSQSFLPTEKVNPLQHSIVINCFSLLKRAS